jgi:microcompartment protein CcmK/EutM
MKVQISKKRLKMKKTRLFLVAVLAAVIGFSMASCLAFDVLNAVAAGETVIVLGGYVGKSGPDADGTTVDVTVIFGRSGSGSNSYPSYSMIYKVTDAFGNAKQVESSGNVTFTKAGEGIEEVDIIAIGSNITGTLTDSTRTIVIPDFLGRGAITLRKDDGVTTLPPSVLNPGAYYINTQTGGGEMSGLRITFGEGNTYEFHQTWMNTHQPVPGTYTVVGDQITFQPNDPAQKVMTGTLTDGNRTMSVTLEIEGYELKDERFTRRAIGNQE